LDPSARFYDVGNGVLAIGREELAFDVKTADGSQTGKIKVRFSLLLLQISSRVKILLRVK